MSEDAIPHLSGYSEAELDQAFAAISREVEASAAALATPDAVEQFRLHWVGRKQGRLKAISDAWLKSAPAEAKKRIGQRFNTLKAEIEQRLESAAQTGHTRTHSKPKPSTSPYLERSVAWAPSTHSSRLSMS